MKKPPNIYSNAWIKKHGIKARECNLYDTDKIDKAFCTTAISHKSFKSFVNGYEKYYGIEMTIREKP